MLIRDLCLPESAGSPAPSESPCESTATTPVEEMGTPEQRMSKNVFIAPFPAGQYIRPPEMAYGFECGGDGRFLPAFSDMPRRLGPADNIFNMRTSQVPQMNGTQNMPAFGYRPAFAALPEYERRWPPEGLPRMMPEQERQQYPTDPFDIALQMASQRCIMGRHNPFSWPQNDSQQQNLQQLLPKKPDTPKPAVKKTPPRKAPSKQQTPRKTAPKKASEKAKPPRKQAPKTQAKGKQSEDSLEKRPLEALQEGRPRESVCIPRRPLLENRVNQELLTEEATSQKTASTEPTPREVNPQGSRPQNQRSRSEGLQPKKPLFRTASSQPILLPPAHELGLDVSQIPHDEEIDAADYVIDLTQLSDSEDEPIGQQMSAEEIVERYRQEASRKRPADDDSEDDEEEDDESRRLPANCGIGYACPFYKRNRPKYFPKRICRSSGWPSVHRVKEHLYRHHMHTACDRCASTFSNRDELREHLRQPAPCKVSVHKVAEDTGFGMETEKKLRSRKKLDLHSESDKWAHMFRILFPSYEGKITPSPIVIDVEAAMFSRDLVAAKLQEAGDSSISPFATVHESITNALNMVTAVAEHQLRLGEGSADSDLAEVLVSEETQALYESSMKKLAALAEEFEAAMVSIQAMSEQSSSVDEGRAKKRLRKEE